MTTETSTLTCICAFSPEEGFTEHRVLFDDAEVPDMVNRLLAQGLNVSTNRIELPVAINVGVLSVRDTFHTVHTITEEQRAKAAAGEIVLVQGASPPYTV